LLRVVRAFVFGFCRRIFGCFLDFFEVVLTPASSFWGLFRLLFGAGVGVVGVAGSSCAAGAVEGFFERVNGIIILRKSKIR
jgi:hypothetical protein